MGFRVDSGRMVDVRGGIKPYIARISPTNRTVAGLPGWTISTTMLHGKPPPGCLVRNNCLPFRKRLAGSVARLLVNLASADSPRCLGYQSGLTQNAPDCPEELSDGSIDPTGDELTSAMALVGSCMFLSAQNRPHGCPRVYLGGRGPAWGGCEINTGTPSYF